jgi:hypothetical protein
MTSTLTEIIVLILAGIAGGNAAGSAAKEFNLGTLRNTLAGAVAGGAGYFLQPFIPPTVDINGNPVLDDSIVNHLLILALLGLALGGVLIIVLGFMKSEACRRR